MEAQIIELLELLGIDNKTFFGLLVVIGLAAVQYLPGELRPLSWLKHAIRKLLLDGIDKKITAVGTQLSGLVSDYEAFKDEVKERQAVEARSRISLFADDLYHNDRPHSKDSFEQILEDINFYMDYCEAHRGFRNNITQASIDMINRSYADHLNEKKFI
jgi:hypothetical protein